MFGTKNLTIPGFYEGKSVFLTGGTGFVGKLIVEKLLRSCPDIKNIYLLIRTKKSMTVEERVNKYKNDAIFSVLQNTNSNALDKIIPIPGDIMELSLGISNEDRITLIEHVSVVFHVAASVRFDDFLQTAIFVNVRSTREIIKLVEQLKTIDVFVHVSTAYSNYEIKEIDEKVYPLQYDWRDAISLAECLDQEVKINTNYLSQKFIEPKPNTYLFTKSLAESLVNELCTNKFPSCIIRPSIVAPTLDEPLVGYTDNFNGPVSFFIASGSGICRVLKLNPNIALDHVFGDNLAKATIIASWRTGIEKNLKEVNVYNSTSDFNYTGSSVCELGTHSLIKNPLKYYIATPYIQFMTCTYGYYIYNILFHLMPALFFDMLLKIMSQDIRILTLRKKMAITNIALLPFLMPSNGKPWTFLNKNYINLENLLKESDKKAFSFLHNRTKGVEDKRAIQIILQILISKTRTFLLEHEREQATEEEVLRYKRFLMLDKLVKRAFWCFIFYLAVWKYNLLTNLTNGFLNYIENLW